MRLSQVAEGGAGGNAATEPRCRSWLGQRRPARPNLLGICSASFSAGGCPTSLDPAYLIRLLSTPEAGRVRQSRRDRPHHAPVRCAARRYPPSTARRGSGGAAPVDPARRQPDRHRATSTSRDRRPARGQHRAIPSHRGLGTSDKIPCRARTSVNFAAPATLSAPPIPYYLP